MSDTLTHNFAELLEKARGPRTVNEFAASCGISRAHFFRIKNGTVPSKKICKQLSEDWYVRKVGISAKEVYEAAGYIYDDANVEAYHYAAIGNIGLYQMAIDWSIIAKALMALEVEIKLINVAESDESFAFRLFGGKKETAWKFIVLNDSLTGLSDKEPEDMHYYILGRILSIDVSEGEQYTLLLHNSQAFERMISQANLFKRHRCISIALIDIYQMKVMREAVIGSGGVKYTLTGNKTEFL